MSKEALIRKLTARNLFRDWCREWKIAMAPEAAADLVWRIELALMPPAVASDQ